MYIVGCYVSYLLISLAVTIWVAHTLHKNGRIFLVDAFHGNAELADSVNHLLVVGFCLISVGYIGFPLNGYVTLDTRRAAIELVSGKTAGLLLLLGVTLFFDAFLLTRVRGNAIAMESRSPSSSPASRA